MRNDPTGRALHLLSLLQTHRLWRGSEIAERLEVTERTVRRDVDRLRDLGYPVDATPGAYGGYRLAVGAHLPPLVLDDDEAVAIAVGLRSAAGAAISGIEETSLQALAKIEQLLPDRLRRRVSALGSSVTAMRWSPSDTEVIDSDALVVLASACRDHEEVRFDYRRRDGEDSRRLVEPHQMVTAGRRWYLVAWDLRRDDWRTFRMDRLSDAARAGRRFTAREIPGGDAADFVATSLSSIPREIEALVAVGAPYTQVEDVLRWTEHSLVETEPDTCVVRLRTDNLDWLVLAIARIALTAPATVIEPTDVADAVDLLADRLTGLADTAQAG
jgi:predicted DNA-binding transcriptional regulator YafY